LLDDLTTLDDAHERRQLDAAAYAERRAALKAQLARRMPSMPVKG